MTITQPSGLTLQRWADSVVIDLDSLAVVPKIDGDDWQTWGSALSLVLPDGALVPNPYGFTDWLEWAERLCGALA